ncbi:MAG: hypothetical protein FD126_871 [Elusimicrobia bacterium]|nr:MAG: hypothetical protein FD126_871 [Elusimicrobiota bacterium]
MAVRKKKSEKPPLSPLDVLNVTGPKKAKAPKAVKAAAPRAAKTPKALAVLLEYPRAGEQVLPGHYAVRIAAKPEVTVEISVDGAPFQPCREAVGYYWFDWTPSALGTHTLVARAKNGGPRTATTEERTVLVVETPSAN